MSEMIERVAAALKSVPIRDRLNEGGELDGLRLREAARAAIEAMRKPIEDVVCAGDEKIIEALNDHTFALRDPTPAAAAWQAMIDAALNEKSPAAS